jgi:hypothetical protein
MYTHYGNSTSVRFTWNLTDIHGSIKFFSLVIKKNGFHSYVPLDLKFFMIPKFDSFAVQKQEFEGVTQDKVKNVKYS